MTCDEAEILLHALIDGELDAGHAREVESHVAGCPRCAALLRDYKAMSKTIAQAGVRYTAPAALRQRIEGALPQPLAAPNRRAVLRGFAMGSAVSAYLFSHATTYSQLLVCAILFGLAGNSFSAGISSSPRKASISSSS